MTEYISHTEGDTLSFIEYNGYSDHINVYEQCILADQVQWANND